MKVEVVVVAASYPYLSTSSNRGKEWYTSSMQDAKEEVRARLNIEDVISEYVQLKRAGRNFKGLSPFTSEKSPSFVVSPDKHIWHDFSSGKGGDVFSFVMEVEGLDFRGALEQLARKAGVDMSQYDTQQSGEVSKKKKRFLEAHELATQYYQQSLVRNKHAVDYVFGTRKFDKPTVTEFRIGYAPESNEALVQFLAKKGFTTKELGEAGLTNRYGGDLFRGRIVIPLMDGAGQVIGFTGRTMSSDPKAPKYLNTPQTLIYDKSRHVFGLSQAKEAIRKGDHSVIVEGNLDVVASHQAGIKQVVATAGTALTEPHLKALSRLSHSVRLAFDADKAGLAATERAIPIAEQVGVALTIISLPGDAKDPDELVQKDPALWLKAIDQAEPVVDWVLAQYSQREDLASAAGKRAFTSAALAVVQNLSDVVEQEHYQAKIAAMTDTSLETIKHKQADAVVDKGPTRPLKISQKQTEIARDSASYQDNLLSVALIDVPSQELFASIDATMFAGEERQAVAAYLRSHSGKLVEDTPKALQSHDTYVKILLLKAETRYSDWNDQDRYFETARLLRQVATQHKKQQKEVLTSELREAEEAGDDSRSSELRNQLNELIKEISRGQRE
ncbi:MAG: primase [Candidatus Saccharibacteria bacterium]|nr:primase [Candidatus Saccharibacteria bacterium]